MRKSLSDGADASFSDKDKSSAGQGIPISGSSGFIAHSWLGEYGVESKYEIIVSSSRARNAWPSPSEINKDRPSSALNY